MSILTDANKRYLKTLTLFLRDVFVIFEGGETKLLDAYCCSGGASAGYMRAGFTVVGVDIDPQPNYIGDDFVQADAVEYIKSFGHLYDFIHASPPCQADCALNVGTNQGKFSHESLLEETRRVLEGTGKPYVIEQPNGRAALRKDLVLCGEMFSLSVIRHRNFELGNWSCLQPAHKPHRGRVAGFRHGEWFTGPYFAVYGNGGGKGSVKDWQEAMDIHWTDVRRELSEAIPPAYTEYIGREFLGEQNQ